RVYLLSHPERDAAPQSPRGRAPMAERPRLHELPRTTSPDARVAPCRLFGDLARLLAEPRGVTRHDFLHGDESWLRIDEAYRRDCPEGSFSDYFWTIRATHAAVFTLAEHARRLPPARAYHAVSTGYAGLLAAL